MNNSQYSCFLSREIQKTYASLRDLVTPLSLKDRLSVSDIIAYQIGWGQRLLEWYESDIQNRDPAMPGDGFLTWDYIGLAKHFHQKYHLDGSSKQMALFHKTVQQIIFIVETEYQAERLDQIGVWNWCTLKSGKQWPLSKWVQVNTVAPYRKALQSIRKRMKQL